MVTVPSPSFGDYLALGVEEVAHWGAEAPRVQDRLRGMLRDLVTVALPEHRPALAAQLARWQEALEPGDTVDLTPSDHGLRPAERGSSR